MAPENRVPLGLHKTTKAGSTFSFWSPTSGSQPTAIRQQARQSYGRQGHKAARKEAVEDCEYDEPTCVVNAYPAKYEDARRQRSRDKHVDAIKPVICDLEPMLHSVSTGDWKHYF